MAGSLDVVVRFLSDASQVTSEVSKIEDTQSRLKSWAKGVAGAVGVAFAVHKVSDFVSAAEEANSVSAGLAQTMRNAGDATGAWTAHAEKLAATLMRQTGIDDEVIKGGQTILATFHQLSGPVGQTSGAFDRATKAAVDLSAAGFGSVESAATMLGKALEDPEKGLTALGKAGVTFLPEQKAQIKAMTDAGQSAIAMATILGIVENQVKGVAASSATSGEKMRVAWGETQEALGNALLPVLTRLAPILQDIAKFVQKNATWLVPIAGLIAGIAVAVKIATVAQIAWNIAAGANPAGAIVLAIVAAIAALIVIVKLIIDHWDQIKAVAVAAWQAIMDAIQPVVDFVKEAFDTILGVVLGVWNWIKEHWPLLLAILTGPFGLSVKFVIDHLDQILDFIKSIPGKIADFLGSVFDIITAPFDRAIGFVKGIWNSFARAWNGITIHIPSVDVPLIGKIGGGSVSLPDLPTLARGGVVTRATLAILGEAGPEAVIPLARAGAVGHTTFNVTVNVPPTANAADVGRVVIDQIRAYERQNGRAWRAAS
jgi:phage-related protein